MIYKEQINMEKKDTVIYIKLKLVIEHPDDISEEDVKTDVISNMTHVVRYRRNNSRIIESWIEDEE